MCRYAIKEYKAKYVCFDCCKTFKQRFDVVDNWQDVKERTYPCPQCQEPMASLGHDFKAPRQSNRRQWEKVRQLAHSGLKFGSCGCQGPGVRPRTLGEFRMAKTQSEALNITVFDFYNDGATQTRPRQKLPVPKRHKTGNNGKIY